MGTALYCDVFHLMYEEKNNFRCKKSKEKKCIRLTSKNGPKKIPLLAAVTKYKVLLILISIFHK